MLTAKEKRNSEYKIKIKKENELLAKFLNKKYKTDRYKAEHFPCYPSAVILKSKKPDEYDYFYTRYDVRDINIFAFDDYRYSSSYGVPDFFIRRFFIPERILKILDYSDLCQKFSYITNLYLSGLDIGYCYHYADVEIAINEYVKKKTLKSKKYNFDNDEKLQELLLRINRIKRENNIL